MAFTPATPNGPTPALPAASGGFQLGEGNVAEPLMTRQAAILAFTGTALTLTPANLITGIITSFNASAVTFTLPLATDLDAAVPQATINSAFEFSVINTGSVTGAAVATNTGWTLVGAMTVLANTAGKFRAVKRAAGTWTLYLVA